MSGDVEQEARNMGWLPKETFPGNPDTWVDADTFVDRGKHVMPILLQNNKRLQGQIDKQKQETEALRLQLKESSEVITQLQTSIVAVTKKEIASTRNDLQNKLQEARDVNDAVAEEAIREQLADLKTAEKEADKKPLPKKDAQQEQPLSPEFLSWKEENQWFGSDRKKTIQAQRIAEDLRDEEPTLTGREFFDKVSERLAAASGSKSKGGDSSDGEDDNSGGDSKVEGGSRSSSSRSSSSKTYASLPADAKQACAEDVATLVGPNKKFKTAGEYQKYYAEVYWSQS